MAIVANDHIYWRDEILQLLFWMRGEGMGEAQAPAALARFLTLEEGLLRPHLSQMAADGFLESKSDLVALTEMGRTEGSRRFQEEFEPLLSQGHGECSDPNCDCHQFGPDHCLSHPPPGVS